MLAERYGWSLEYSEGYVDGEVSRRQGKDLPGYLMVGRDEYSLGFRAGYFVRGSRHPTTAIAHDPAKGPSAGADPASANAA